MKAIILGALALVATPAAAQDTADAAAQENREHPAPRDLCSDRPGLNTPACTVDPDHLQVEIGIGGWTLDKQPDERTDSFDAGEILLRYGIGATTEVRLGWTAFGHVRIRDRMSGAVDRTTGVGDVTLGLKQNLKHPAESKTGMALALLPYVTLPTGHSEIGAGDWGAGLIVPASYKLSDSLSLALSPEIDAAVNERGNGRHLAYGTAMGMQASLSDTMKLTPELQIMRDRDPDHHATMSSAALSLGMQPVKMTQIDIQAVAGLNHDTPDIALSFGVTRKF